MASSWIAPVAAGQNGLAVAAIAAVPGGDDAAGAFDQRNQRRDIPAVEAGLDDDVDKAQRQRREQIAVAADSGSCAPRLHPRRKRRLLVRP